jgi:hypothetical protein
VIAQGSTSETLRTDDRRAINSHLAPIRSIAVVSQVTTHIELIPQKPSRIALCLISFACLFNRNREAYIRNPQATTSTTRGITSSKTLRITNRCHQRGNCPVDHVSAYRDEALGSAAVIKAIATVTAKSPTSWSTEQLGLRPRIGILSAHLR